MSISLSLYDFFANMIPGLLYLFMLNELLRSLDARHITLSDINSTAQVLATLVIAYILGHLFNTFSFKPWYKLFIRKYDDKMALETINNLYPELKLGFASKDSDLLFIALQTKNKELADRIEVSRVNAIMMRNISLGLFLLGAVELLNFGRHPQEYLYLVLGISCVVFSMVSIRQAARYYQWFYRDIFKSAAVYGDSLKSVLNYLRKDVGTKSK